MTWSSLAARIEGRVVTPDHPDYDTARGGWNLTYTHRPSVVVEAASADDVVSAIREASGAGVGVTVQATGHGFTTAGEDILIATAGIDRVDVDPTTATARIGAGAKWEPVLVEAQRHGLAPLLGSSPGVGAVGYTLGGGFGWLGRRHGLCIDKVRWFRVVLADGSLVTASAEENPDLFWALRGGGHGSLGVVVEMEIELVEASEVYGGNLLYPIEMAMEVFDRYREWSHDLPDEITSAFTIMNYPPIDDVPEPVRGRSFAIVRGCHCGDMEEAASLIESWRRWREPAIDMFGPMPFGEVAAISQDPVDPVPAISSARWLTGLDLEVGEAIVEAAAHAEVPSPVIIAETRQAGGAISRPPSDTAYSTRHAERLLQVVALTPDPKAVADTDVRMDRLWERLGDRVVAPYLNFLEGEERRELGRSAFDTARWERLAAIKAKLDPDEVFSSGLVLG
jgi:FAD/FMN-containing dehydrogenase